MKRLLLSIIFGHEIGNLIASAKACSRLARQCAAQSSVQCDAWDQAAFKHRQRRRYYMDLARALLP